MAVKSTKLSDQNMNPNTRNVNPASQSKSASQPNQPKTSVAKVKQELVKPPVESAKLEKPQSKHNVKLDIIVCVSLLAPKIYCFFFLLDKPAMKEPGDVSSSKYVWVDVFFLFFFWGYQLL